ncbi:hypothetical protein niasHS_013178 [Heterodera schachtii]|uniref:Uncharacterized protein n=1 Tax=Heterodera schachtii TaxID=97005 RepID=A0ABD2IA14_HETSC
MSVGRRRPLPPSPPSSSSSAPSSSSLSSSSSCRSPSFPSSFLCLPFLLLSSLFLCQIFAVDNANANPNSHGSGDDLPHQLWLLDPSARQLEMNTPPNQRLPETMCPTPKSTNDTTTVLSGTPFAVRWYNPDAIPTEAAKFELFSANSGHLLAKLDTSGGGQADVGNKTAMVNVRIPDALHCDTCVLRLSVELDERIQLLSCADVRVVPAEMAKQSDNKSGKECAADEQCGGGTRGKCAGGQCFCRKGFHGTKCGKESADFASFALPKSVSTAHSVRFPITGSELLWKAYAQDNILELGLRLNIDDQPKGQRWFILGVQSTEEDEMCQLAMAQLKQNAIPLEGDEVQLITGELSEKSVTKSVGAGLLNIRRLANGTSAESEVQSNNGTKRTECSANEHFDVCPETGRECEPSCDWTAFPDSIPSCAPRGEQCGQPRCVCAEGFVRLSNQHDECKPFSFCQAPEVDAATVPIPAAVTAHIRQPSQSASPVGPPIAGPIKCAANETLEKCGRACEPSCDTMYSEEPCGEACEAPGCTCDDNFVRLSARGGPCVAWTDCPNLKEMAAPTRPGFSSPSPFSSSSDASFSPPAANISSTLTTEEETTELELFTATENAAEPPEVGQCDSNETVNECGRVCETDCVSIFEREECHGCAAPACSCRQGFARSNGKCVYWGDCPTVAIAASSDQSKGLNNLESTIFPSGERALSSPTKGTANGAKSVETSAEEMPLDLCGGEWAWPIGCAGEKCAYRLRWDYDEKMNSVVFLLDTRPMAAKKAPKGAPIWSGVGFSPSGTLLDADMAILEVSGDGTKVRPMDMHVNEELEQLRTDSQQDIFGEGKFSDGILRAKFWRKLHTDDEAGEDLEFGDENTCFRFLFPVAGGRFEKSDNVTVPVADSLYASDADVCMRSCALKAQQVPTATGAAKESGCEGTQCEYKAQWALGQEGDDVQFNISARGIGRWTGIGFSRDGRMAGADIVTGWMFNQKAFLIDRFAHNQQLPAIDPADRQDLFDIGGSVEDDIQTISFRRKVISADRSTDLPLDECLFFLFPVAGGRVLARTSHDFQNARTPIGYHDQQQPERSAKRICQCGRRAGGQKKSAARRAKRGADDGESAKTAAGGPYQCADVTIIQILERGDAVRVIDAFALSNDSLFRDERWGGRQSIVDVTIEKDNKTDKMNIWLRKKMTDDQNAKGDLAVRRGVTPVFLASGMGPEPGMNAAERLEFAMIDLMAGASTEIVSSTEKSPTTTPFATVSSTVSSTTSAKPTTTSAEVASSTTKAIGTTTEKAKETTQRRITIETTTTEAEQTEEVPPFTEESGSEPNLDIGPAVVPPAVVVQGGDDSVDEPTITAVIPELIEPMLSTAFDKPSPSPSPTSLSTTSPSKVPVLPPAMLMDENCFGGFAHPENCLGTELCNYMVEWQVVPAEQAVHFRLSAKMKPATWTGIGFSSDGSMVGADAILVLLLSDGRISVSDQFSPGYGRPLIDSQQNAHPMGQFGVTDGVVAVNFSRPLFTGDTAQDADLRQCQSFLFLHSGGPLVHGSAEIRKHTVTPIRSKNRICLAKCGQQTPTEGLLAPTAEAQPTSAGQTAGTKKAVGTVPTTVPTPRTDPSASTAPPTGPRPSPTTAIPAPSPPPKSSGKTDGAEVRIAGGNIGTDEAETTTEKGTAETVFNVAIRLTNERWDELLEDAGSAIFRDLAQRVANSIRSIVVVKWPSLRDVQVQKFAEGSVLALLQLHFHAHEAPNETELKDFLQDAAAQGMAEELIWDRDMLDVKREGQAEDEEDKWGALRDLQGWALVSVALLLLLCTLSALIFCAFRSHRKRRSAAHRTYPAKQSPYSAGYHHHVPQYAALGANGCDKASDTTIKTSATSRAGNGTENGKANGQNGANRTETPKGIGEATYREWFSKVASKNSPSHYQESSLSLTTPPTPMARHSVPHSPLQSYVSYPNDPSFYTLNGEHRIVPPPPAYFHHQQQQRPY